MSDKYHEKFQIVVDSDLDGICSAAIFYKFIHEFYPDIECVFSLHTAKQHGLSSDIKIDENTTLVICPDSATNDVKQCDALYEKGISVICFDHHIIEQPNPHAAIVSCIDGKYPNQHLCGAAVTWLFLYGYCHKRINFFDEHKSYLLQMLDLVAVATISDIMEVTNEDNMYFIQNGLSNIQSKALRAFLLSNEVSLNDVTIEDIKFKVSPLISAMIRMGNVPEKTLLFRAFIDDYEEFDYEKRGSFDVVKENIYDRVVRLCKNAKSRQDRAKQKLLDECQVYEYPHILLVEYQADKSSTLTGLVANELANKYCKPCIVFHQSGESADGNETHPVYSGSIRNYDGSPISSFKAVLEFAFKNKCDAQGHDNAAGFRYYDNLVPDEFEKQFSIALFSSYWDTIEDVSPVAIGEKEFQIDFSIPADALDAGFIQKLHWFERYSGYGFAPVIALVTGIKVCQENFKTMGKNTFNWKIFDEDTGVSYVKFKIDRDTDELIQKFDDVDLGATTYFDTGYVIDAICTFGLNVYNGEIHAQAVIKDYIVQSSFKKESFDDDDDFDLDFDL